jgi:hypothetical protein
VNLTVIWRSLLGACELIHTFVCARKETATNFFLNNQPDGLFIQIYCHKTLHVSDNFFAHHQESPTVHSALVSFMQIMMTASKQSQDLKK